MTLNLNYARNVIKSAMIIRMFPEPLKPYVAISHHACVSLHRALFRIVARMLSNLPSKVRQETEFIRPMVEERFARMEEFGDDWEDKPVCPPASLNDNVAINAECRTTCSCGS